MEAPRSEMLRSCTCANKKTCRAMLSGGPEAGCEFSQRGKRVSSKIQDCRSMSSILSKKLVALGRMAFYMGSPILQ